MMEEALKLEELAYLLAFELFSFLRIVRTSSLFFSDYFLTTEDVNPLNFLFFIIGLEFLTMKDCFVISSSSLRD